MQQQAPDTQPQRGIGDRGAGPTGAELQDVAKADIGQSAPEALQEARPVGIVPDPPAVPEDDGVDGAKRPRVLGQLVEQRDHLLLAGMGDVQSCEAGRLGTREDVGQCLRPSDAEIEVEELVAEIEALCGCLVPVHRRRARLLDAGPDQPDPDRRSRHGLSRSSRRVPAPPRVARGPRPAITAVATVETSERW